MSAGKDHEVDSATKDPERPARGRKEYVDAARDMLSVRARKELEQGTGHLELQLTAIWQAIADLQKRGGVALLPADAEDEKLVDALVARREKAAR